MTEPRPDLPGGGGMAPPAPGLRTRLDESLRARERRERRRLLVALAVVVPIAVATAYLLQSGPPSDRLGDIAVGAMLGSVVVVRLLRLIPRD